MKRPLGWSPLCCWMAVLLVTGLVGLVPKTAGAEEFVLHSFRRQQLTDLYLSEGANGGDLNNDKHVDVVYGPYWFAGPDFKVKHEIYPMKPQNREGYADNFFNWVYDFNGDGWNDVFVVGFPGTPAYVYENPKEGGFDKPWKKHQVFDSVANESPQFVNLVGDARPELVCTHQGAFGFAAIDWDRPFEPWRFHRISNEKAPDRFGHGLGIGDINGDQRQDILMASGWFEQPKESPGEAPWTFHPAPFTNAYGGAEMYAYDVDGDGDNDVITSLAAHDFGLAWYEQEKVNSEIVWRQRLIMGDRPEKNRYGVVFSELHSVALVDLDGDGLQDIVTGKTFYSHHKGSPMWDAGAVVYWFRLTRTEKGVDWVPYQLDGQAGIGRQISIVDVNQDNLPDIVVGGMVGAHVLFHARESVEESKWRAAQPIPLASFRRDQSKIPNGQKVDFDSQTGRLAGALEAEQLKVGSVSAGQTSNQAMTRFVKDRWSDSKQLFWTGASPGARLELLLPVEKDGDYQIAAAFSMARDYAIVRLHLDDEQLGADLDLYHYPEVLSTGLLQLGRRKLAAGEHRFVIEIVGANPSALPVHLVGIDYVKLTP